MDKTCIAVMEGCLHNSNRESHVRVQSYNSTVHFGHIDPCRGMQDLAMEIRFLDCVTVHKSYSSDPRAY